MQICRIIVSCKDGSDAMKLASVIRTASEFKSLIKLECQNKSANAKSLIGVMAIHIEPGMQLDIVADGPDEKEAIQAMSAILDPKPERTSKFHPAKPQGSS